MCYGPVGIRSTRMHACYDVRRTATAMSTTFGAGFHAAPGKAVDASAYERWTGRWSRLFVPAVLAAAAVGPKCRVLDVSTGTGEAARMALPLVGTEGVVHAQSCMGRRFCRSRPMAKHYRSATPVSTQSFASWACNSFRIQRGASENSGAFCARTVGWRYV